MFSEIRLTVEGMLDRNTLQIDIEGMINLHPEYVVDEKHHRKAVILAAPEWESLLKELEELDDIRAYDTAQAHLDDRLPFEQAVREIQQDYPE